MQYDLYTSLLSSIQDAWHGHYSLSSLSSLLSSHLLPLSSVVDPPPSPSSRASIESRNVRIGDASIDLYDTGDPTRTQRKTIDYLLHIATQLHIDELLTVRLVTAASASTSPSTLPLDQRVVTTHFTRRYNLLVALLDLLLMYHNPAFPSDLLLVIDQCVEALLERGLASTLIRVIGEVADRVKRVEGGTLQSQLTQELHHLLRILLALTRKVPLQAAQAVELLALLQRLSGGLEEGGAGAGGLIGGGVDVELQFTCYSLLTSFISTLDAQLTDLVTQHPPPSASLPSSQFPLPSSSSDAAVKAYIAAISSQGEREGSTGWRHFTFQAAYLLSFSLFLRRVKPLYPDVSTSDLQVTNLLLLSISADVSLFSHVYTQLLTSPILTVDPRRGEMAEVWTQLYSALTCEAADELELLKDDEPHAPEVGGYYYLLMSMAALCRMWEGGVEVMWGAGEGGVVGLLKSDLGPTTPVTPLLASPLLPAYIALLSALTQDGEAGGGQEAGENAWKVFEILRGTELLSWRLMFFIFQQVIQLYLPPSPPPAVPPPPPPPISPPESALLSSFLSLFTSVLASPAVQSAFAAKSSEYRALDRLFALLGCRLDTPLKSHILDALTAFSHSAPVIASQVWERMDRAGVLPRGEGTVQGLYYDVEEVESVQRRYPLTIAFSRLVLTLLCVGPPPPSGVDYVRFVTSTLFLSLNDRQYTQPLERWKLTECSLACATLVLTLDDTAGGGTGSDPLALSIAKELLAGKEALVKLLEVISRAYQLLEAESTPPDTPHTEGGSALERGEEGLRAIEGSLSCGVRLLWELTRREEEWVERIRRDGTRAYTLSSLLFNHPQEVLVIAHATAHLSLYPPSFATRTLAEREAERRRSEGGEEEGVDEEEDGRGVIAYHSALLFHSLTRTADTRLAHLLLASRLAPDISRAFAAQLRLTQLGSSLSGAERNSAHLARIELVKTLVESVEREGGEGGEGEVGGVGVVLLGFDVGRGEVMQKTRLQASDRKFTLDALIDLVRKPR